MGPPGVRMIARMSAASVLESARNLGSRSTAQEALGGVSLKGCRLIVTGASSGLGIETARVLARAGGDVVMACRDTAAGERVAAELRTGFGPNAGTLSVAALDLADLESVAAFARGILEGGQPLDHLVNNAGVMATPLSFTKQGFELQVGTNHVGHYLLTRLLLPALERAPAARVVTLSSALHTRGRGERLLRTLGDDRRYESRRYAPFDAYGDAKLANASFARALAKRVPQHITSLSVHPGVIATALSRSMGVMGVVFRTVGRPFMKSVPQGAATSVFAVAAPELSAHSGAYLADCAVARASAEARDEGFADTLWDRTEALVDAYLR